MFDFQYYEVGGCVRDAAMGVSTKDVDYTVVGPGYQALINELDARGFDRFLPLDVDPEPEASLRCREALTVRARFPKSMTHFQGRDIRGLTADFVLARKEGTYSDGRHPDDVQPGTLMDDLRRRDFTMNAMAVDFAGGLIDPFDGLQDIKDRIIRCVGKPEDRFREDALRALRAIRFAVTKRMALDGAVRDALASEWLPPLLTSVSVERRAQELLKAFRHDTMDTLLWLQRFPALTQATFMDGLWLMPTLKG